MGIYKFFHAHYHRRYHGVYQHAKQLFVFDLFLLAIAIGMLGTSVWFFFWKPGIQDLIELNISLGDTRIKSGQEVRITVEYTNHSKATLNHETLALKLPAGFVINRNKTPESVFSKAGTFTLPDLPPGASGQSELYGHLWVRPGISERIIATLSYTPEKRDATEQKYAAFYVQLSESVLTASFSLPSASFPKLTSPLIVRIRNESSEEISGVTVLTRWPASLPDFDPLKNITFSPGEVKVVTTSIVFPSSPGSYTLQIVPAVVANNHLIELTPTEGRVSVFYPTVNSSVTAQNVVPYIEPQETLPVTVSWSNDSTFNLLYQRLRLTPTPGTVNLKKTALENNLKVDGNSLVADATNRTALANGSPGNSDTFSVNVSFLPHFSIAPDAATSTWFLTPVFVGELTEVPGQLFKQVGTPLSIPLSTELNWTNQVRYYTDEGDQLGRGPLPPQVDATTKYWITFNILNTTNAVDDAYFEATLPAGVSLTGRQSVTIGPNVKYDIGSNKITWNYRELPANSQTGLFFEVAVTPSAAQAGKNLLLLKDISFSATDDIVGRKFLLKKPDVSNVLPTSDQGAAAGSIVTQ